MHAWEVVTAFGDSAVLLPCIVMPTFWLSASRTTRALTWRWLLLLALVATLVAASKLAFMVWGIGVSSLDFTGASGHSAMSAAVWPTLLSLLGRGERRDFGVAGATAGLGFATAIAMSRVMINAHSWTEVFVGFFFGAAAAGVFLWRLGSRWRLESPVWPLALTLLLLLPITFGLRFPSEHLFHVVAKRLSSDSSFHVRHHSG